MTLNQGVSKHFLGGVRTNIAYWQTKVPRLQKKSEISVSDYPNVHRAVWLGLAHPETAVWAGKLMSQLFLWVEEIGEWDDWLSLMKRAILFIRDKALLALLHKQEGQLYCSKQQPDKAIRALQNAIPLAESSREPLILAEAHLQLANAFLQKRDGVTAQQYASLARQQLEALEGVDRQKSAVFDILGRIALLNNDLPQSENLLNKAVELGCNHQFPTQLARTLTALAITLHHHQKYDEAEHTFLKALDLIKDTPAKLDKVRLELSLGTLYFDQNKLDDAENLFFSALQTVQAMAGQYYWLAMTANNLGFVLLKKGNLLAAEQQLRRSVELRRMLKLQLPLANSCKSLAQLLLAQGKRVKANALLEEAIQTLSEFPNDKWAQELLQECVALQEN